MDLENLLENLPVKAEAELIALHISQHPNRMKNLWNICISNRKNSWRAAWILEKVYDISPELVRIYIPDMLARVPEMNEQSKLRHFLKLISHESLPTDISGNFIQCCFELLTSNTSDIAVQVHAMQILYNFSMKEPDIQQELIAIIHEKMQYASAGVCARGKKILKKIRQAQ